MTKIKKYAEMIEEELESAKEYAETFIDCKARGASNWSSKFHEMAIDELKHAGYLHEKAVAEITELERSFKPTEEMLEKWEHEHKEFVEKTAFIKQILSM